MQVPLIDIDRINDLQVGLNSLQNPSFPIPSQITTSLAYNFCKWGAVILALVATFGSIINRVTIFIIRFRAKAPSLPSLTLNDDNFYTSSSSDDDDDDDNDDDLTYSSSEPEDEPSASSSFIRLDDYFRLRGTDNNNNNNLDDEFQTQNGTHKRCRSIGDIFSLSELANSKSVVKLWDTIGFGLGLDFDDYDGYYVGNAAVPTSSTASPSVVVSAGEGACGNLALEIWDTRLRRRKPTVVAEWGPTVGKTLRVESGGVQKVYVRDDGRYGVTVGDMRKVSTPLESVTESDADTWWDADAIVVSDESFGEQQSMLQQPT
ncbi:hypothetical protein AAZX31_01G073700 [Glycine max]|uniref:Uncharacterized protein n=2 Tax=Glycine subgen. Soja TaxID=1462606 RepID=I1J6J6_SOYBN|nr:uncharacterized protein LOC102663973 [Glycine max]XP_028235496.1 uncharacterized protein LOC114415114 [Glycine soja]KAG5059874.1 hypothetical protein JHK87_000903 [Glycine soja]KAG5068543.1 hypothetical protein JHK85_000920 [Glycine max]KAG5088276.1 hypothetical protein JHK86_000888 [Glycine max]KAH1162155.1 hypothetical protein GYH30_000865 [Glycine max]KAH1265267.1 hypothetical protein GmHk_01G001003 [Glycine max]|eukprot:XP_006574065.1 uncharacterized protein LOC102663973 [Glycine max]